MGAALLDITPSGGPLGATIHGVDLSAPFDAPTTAAIRAALLDHEVLFFPGQDLTPEQHVAFGQAFGPLQRHDVLSAAEGHPELVVLDSEKLPTTEVPWHTDVTCSPSPPMGSILQLLVVPPQGGATHWASMTAAYAALDADVRRRLDGLTAVHRSWWEPVQETVHPVVVTHPEKGTKSLFVNAVFTTRICELADAESTELLQMLFAHAAGDEFSIQHDWQTGDVAFWDNRCTQHRVDNDYGDAHRRGQRVTIDGTQPSAA